MGVPDHLTCVLRNPYAVRKQQLEPDTEQLTGSKLGKDYDKAVYSHSAYLTYMQSTSCKMPGWMNHKWESKDCQEKNQQPQICRRYHPYGRKRKGTEDPLMSVKEESEKADLKLNIPKTTIMTSGPITSWKIEGKKVEAVTDFIFLGSKITANGDCSHEIKDTCSLEEKL